MTVDQMILSLYLTQNNHGLNAVFNFKVKLISCERALVPFLATSRKTRVMGLQRNLSTLPEPYLTLKKRSL